AVPAPAWQQPGRRPRTRSRDREAGGRVPWREHPGRVAAREGQYLLHRTAGGVPRRWRVTRAMNQNDILLIEDYPDDAELIRLAFAQAGIDRQLVVVRDGAEALDYLFAKGQYAGRDVRQLPAIVLLDLNLPKLDGREVLQAIRGDARTRSLPVVVLTTSDEPFDVESTYAL